MISLSGQGTEDMINRLRAAISADGDFPVRARAVTKLRVLVGNADTPLEKIVEVILSEPVLGARIIHLVNSVVYQRGHPIMTVTQAVTQLGMRALADLCTGLILLQKFSPVAKRGGIFADSVIKTILTSLLTSLLTQQNASDEEEQGYLAGTFFSIGPMLLAYYFPQVFEAAEKRALKRKQTTTKSVTEILGVPPVSLSIGVLDSLQIPEFYRSVLLQGYEMYVEDKTPPPSSGPYPVATGVALAAKLADIVVETKSAVEFRECLQKVEEQFGVDHNYLRSILETIPHKFEQHGKIIEMTYLSLPEHFLAYLAQPEPEQLKIEQPVQDSPQENAFSYFVDEIKEAVAANGSISSIATTVMEALVFGLNFDRAVLLFSDTKGTLLQGKMALGKSFGINAQLITRPISTSNTSCPDVAAYLQGQVQIYGDPIFEDGWPFAAIPIGGSNRTIGVVYADKLNNGCEENSPLGEPRQLALHLLASFLDTAVEANT